MVTTASVYIQSPRFETAWAPQTRTKAPLRTSALKSPVRGRNSAERPSLCSSTKAPKTMQTSPTLKTLLTGQEAGTANMSPRNWSFASPTGTELANWPGSSSRPAVASAERLAGITPPLAAMATKFKIPPSAMISRPGTRRFAHRNQRREAVGRHVARLEQRLRPVGDQVDDRELKPERGGQRPAVVQLEVREMPEPTARDRDGGDTDEQRSGDQHGLGSTRRIDPCRAEA